MKRKMQIISILLVCAVLIFTQCGCTSIVFIGALGELMDEKETDTDYYTEPDTEGPVCTPDVPRAEDKSKATVLIYMNGSDLESTEGQATEDLTEMLAAPYCDEVNIIVQTMGTLIWDDKYDISSLETQRFRVMEDELLPVDKNLGQLDCTDETTLRDFIVWGIDNYPAERYMLIFWNHGGGPVYGFGYDEYQSYEESLTLDEMQKGLESAGVKFDFIGMDCCLMSSIEVCYALSDFCDYMILSEEFESSLGWNYTGWIEQLVNNPSVLVEDLAVTLIDDMIEANKNSGENDAATLALIDGSMVQVLFAAWKTFAYANEDTLLKYNFSMEIQGSGRELPLLWHRHRSEDDDTMADYYITDILAAARNMDSKEASTLKSVLENTIVYYRAVNCSYDLSGMSVTIPYGDRDFYEELADVFGRCGLDNDYIEWLEQFTRVSGYR